MIAGIRPVRGDTGADARVIALKVERGEVTPLVQAAPETPRDIAGIVHHAMAARPEMRFATATEMRLALEGAMTGKRAATIARSAQPGPMLGGTIAMPPRNTAASPAVATNAEIEPHVDTVRAPPIGTALTPGGYAGVSVPVLGTGEGPPMPGRRRRVPVAALVGLSLLLGASVVGILVGTGTLALSSDPPEPPMSTATSPPIATSTTATPAAATATAPVSSATTAVPTLSPARPVPTAPRPAPSNRPSPAQDADAGALPFLFPTAFPSGFPTAFPSGFSLPAGFPSSFPSAFPSAFPGWPSLPVSPPAPRQPAPSVSAGY